MNSEIVILGAGTGGLTTAYWLLKHGVHVIVIEKEHEAGGLMRPVKHKDFMVDFGYKHLYSRIPDVHEFWKEILGEDFLPYQLRTGILYKGHILEREKTFRGLRRGMPYNLLISSFIDLLRYNYHYRKNTITSLQDFTYARRGSKFTKIFSQGFDERLKGWKWSQLPVPGSGIKKGMMPGFLNDAVRSTQKQEQWFHPAKGTGQIVEKLYAEIVRMGGQIYLGYGVTNISHEDNRITAVTMSKGNEHIKLKSSMLVSSLPLQILAPLMGINFVPSHNELSFRRGVIMVYLFLNRPVKFPHTSLQVSCPESLMSRITNYSAYGGDMVPEGKGCLCVEYFTSNAKELFSKNDTEVFEFAILECKKSGLLNGKDCSDFLVIRNPNADPATSWEDYTTDPSRMDIQNQFEQFRNLYQINRTGTDRSTYAGLMAAKAILNGNRLDFDIYTRPDLPTPWEI